MSRFYRAGLPSPKTYLAGMRLVHAAYLFSNPGLSVADVAYRLDYSSPQSFGRHLKAMLGVTAGEFRRRFPFDVSLERYVDLLITPYRETLRAFCPLNAGCGTKDRTCLAFPGRGDQSAAARVTGGSPPSCPRSSTEKRAMLPRNRSASCASCCEVAVRSPIDVISA